MPDIRGISRRLGASTKALASPFFGTSSGGGIQPWVPNARFDFASAAGVLADNSLVSIGLEWIRRNIAQGRLVCGTEDGGDYNEAEDHPMTRARGSSRDPLANWAQGGPGLLVRPNPFESWHDTISGIGEALCIDGNAYLIKARDRLDEVIEVYWVPNQWMQVDPESDPVASKRNGPIRTYWYTYGGYRTPYPPSEIVHFRTGIDPIARWMGFSGLKRQIRNIVSIAEGERYTAAVLRNSHAGKVIAPKSPDVEIMSGGPDEKAMRGLANQIRMGTQGENSGNISPVNNAVELIDVGLGPEAMTLDRILDRPQSYVLASMGLNVLAVGVSGAENVSTFANKDAAHRDAWENGVIPLQDTIAETLRRQLLPDFADNKVVADCVWWDRSDVHALKEDANERMTRAVAGRTAGLLTTNEARALIDQPPQDDGDLTPQEEQQRAMDQQVAMSNGAQDGGGPGQGDPSATGTFDESSKSHAEGEDRVPFVGDPPSTKSIGHGGRSVRRRGKAPHPSPNPSHNPSHFDPRRAQQPRDENGRWVGHGGFEGFARRRHRYSLDRRKLPSGDVRVADLRSQHAAERVYHSDELRAARQELHQDQRDEHLQARIRRRVNERKLRAKARGVIARFKAQHPRGGEHAAARKKLADAIRAKRSELRATHAGHVEDLRHEHRIGRAEQRYEHAIESAELRKQHRAEEAAALRRRRGGPVIKALTDAGDGPDELSARLAKIEDTSSDANP